DPHTESAKSGSMMLASWNTKNRGNLIERLRLFAGSLRAGKRAAAIMSLIRSAQLNGHDPYAYLKDVLERLPTHRADDIAALLPHRWAPVAA
ncbi:transposase domain-containing protein, partial [Burkholderia ubonensis]|uniref:transposase domain-containing protein n=1 Tax=Burkholderia ubonensis TaxID=101571 RepID=UPI000A6FB32E